MIVLGKFYGFVNSENKVFRDWNYNRHCKISVTVTGTEALDSPLAAWPTPDFLIPRLPLCKLNRKQNNKIKLRNESDTSYSTSTVPGISKINNSYPVTRYNSPLLTSVLLPRHLSLRDASCDGLGRRRDIKWQCGQKPRSQPGKSGSKIHSRTEDSGDKSTKVLGNGIL